MSEANDFTKYTRSIVGDLINFRGLVYAPINENGVVFLFGKVVDELNMYIEEIKPGYPDCIARRYIGNGWKRVSIEFEYRSANFKAHKHDPKYCDLIVCWEHDWKDCPLEVIELKSRIKELENYLIEKPESVDVPVGDGSIDSIYINAKASGIVKEWYTKMIKQLEESGIKLKTNVGKKFVGFSSHGKSFASVRIQSQSIAVECFTRGQAWPDTKISHEKYAPRWCKFYINSEDTLTHRISTLIEAEARLREAIKAGEPTGYFSGGEPMPIGSGE